MNRISLWFASVLFLCNFNRLPAQNEFYGLIEKPGAFLPDTVLLFNEDSVPVNITELINKPTVLSFVYFRCPGLCSPLMKGLAELIDESDIKIGMHYQVFTVSIDSREKPSLARAKKQSYLDIMKKKREASENWLFFTGDEAAVKKITDATGWQFIKDNNGFIHSAGVMLITPQKMISQYLYGTYFMPMHFQMAVSEAWRGLSSPPRIKTLKYCYDYLKHANKNTRNITIIWGILVIFAAVGLFLKLVLESVMKKRRSKKEIM